MTARETEAWGRQVPCKGLISGESSEHRAAACCQIAKELGTRGGLTVSLWDDNAVPEATGNPVEIEVSPKASVEISGSSPDHLPAHPALPCPHN